MAEPLKPCAFCASNNLKPIVTPFDKTEVMVQVICCECNARGPSSTNRESTEALTKASEYWNIRK